MTPERFEEVERVCHAALDQPPAAREAFLDDACRGDADLRAEIESLLAAASGAESLLKVPTFVEPRAALTAGQRLGPYQITAPIGAGGMGEVWRARDARLDREVALKVLPPAQRPRRPDRPRPFVAGSAARLETEPSSHLHDS